MKNNNIFIKSTLCLLIGGLITRLIGFVIRIYYTRIIGIEGTSLFSVVMPTYSMLITLATFMLPVTISKLVAENKQKSVSIMQNAALLIFFVNLIVIVSMYFFSGFIASTLLNEPRVKVILICMSLTLPFISISSIIKGYFLGKQRTMPYMVSNVLEQVLRFALIITALPYLMNLSTLHAICGFVMLTIISEIFSIIIFMFFIPKNSTITLSDLKYQKVIRDDILKTSVPSVSSRIIGNIGYFFEPIILTNLLIYSGYTQNYVLTEYAAFNAYAIGVLTAPAFFIQALSQTIIPEISKYVSSCNYLMVKKRVRESMLFTFLVGSVFSIVIYNFRDPLLMLLYNSNIGSDYIKMLAPIFALFYLEGIMYSVMQATGYANTGFKITLIGVIIKMIVLSVLSLCHIGLLSLVYAEIINILFVVVVSFRVLLKEKLI